MKGPVNQFATELIGSGLIPSEVLPSIQGLLTPLMGADWGLTLQDRSLGFVGGNVTLPIYMGGKINTANRAARIMDQLCEAGVVGLEEGTKPRKVLMSMEEFEKYLEENM